ncbi:response regulator transcription factor [Paenibacillus daejeonensis]|uniref:response regulator transcription factor n=1 Tax=Paenibacillus daejeonensis TaxID=135193 RepID=UPI00038071B0|nr:response regulator [Paenibacillus daejeonensis]
MVRVLIVDDEPMIRQGLSKLIRQADAAITETATAVDGADALEKMREQCPDFLFTDIRMPRMDGLELCRRVSETYKDVQIVVVSGYGDFEYARQCMGWGVKQYLLKPVTRSAVYETVGKLLEKLREKQPGGYIPLSTSGHWLETLDQAIWLLQEEQIEQTLDDLEHYCREQRMSVRQLREFVAQLQDGLLQALNRRDVYPLESAPSQTDALIDEQACYTWLRQETGRLTGLIRGKRKGNPKEPIEEAKRYIEQHLSRELSLEEVAERLGLNASYLSQLFRQVAGETFVQYRTKRRIELAKRLLAQPHVKITDISHEVGYADHPHFTKTFKRSTGYTPAEYRGLLGIQG